MAHIPMHIERPIFHSDLYTFTINQIKREMFKYPVMEIPFNSDMMIAHVSKHLIKRLENEAENRLKFTLTLSSDEVKDNFFEIGKKYTLGGEECDGFKLTTKTFELIAIIDSIQEVELNSVVMKQCGGEEGRIFSLTKEDCKKLGINFQQGLLVMPKNLNWVKVEEKKEEIVEEKKEEHSPIDYFDPSDLSTYPCDFNHAVKYMVLRLHGFSIKDGTMGKIFDIVPTSIRINRNTITNVDMFAKTFQIKLKRDLRTIEGKTIKRGTSIPFKFVTKNITNNQFELVDDHHNIYIELALTNNGIDGVQITQLRDCEASDLFQITWFAENILSPRHYGNSKLVNVFDPQKTMQLSNSF